MKTTRTICGILCLSALFLVLSGFNREGDPSKTECLDCHDDIKAVLDEKYLHYPFEAQQCDACHDSETFGFAEEDAGLCTVCHRDFLAEEEKVVHAAVEDCLNCHNPHASKNATLLVDRPPELCYSCHEGLPEDEEPASVHPPYEDGECLTCHDPHISANRSLLVEKPPDLCANCHDPDDADFNSIHLNLLAGDADCFSCHEGHYSTNESLILANAHYPFSEKECDSCHVISEDQTKPGLAAVGAKLCTECHTEIEELLESKFPHLPAEDDCLNCHGPHATSESSLLVETGADLCANCHDDSPASEPAFQEEVHLHPPFSDGDCMDCHSPHGSDNRGILAESEKDLCLGCHSEIDEALEADHPHSAARQGCVACHQPHKGNLATLLKDSGEDLCFRCHESRDKKVFRFVHFPYGEGNCSTCHLPHAGKGDANLTMELEKLCAMCHPSEHKAFPHPVGVKPSANLDIKPDNELNFSRGDEVRCTTCHVPHATDTVFLLRSSVIGGELCYQCHER